MDDHPATGNNGQQTILLSDAQKHEQKTIKRWFVKTTCYNVKRMHNSFQEQNSNKLKPSEAGSLVDLMRKRFPWPAHLFTDFPSLHKDKSKKPNTEKQKETPEWSITI